MRGYFCGHCETHQLILRLNTDCGEKFLLTLREQGVFVSWCAKMTSFAPHLDVTEVDLAQLAADYCAQDAGSSAQIRLATNAFGQSTSRPKPPI
jgi:hypothetical protein